MTTYNTGNPIGSTDPRDLYDNAENLDELVNSHDKAEHPDRLGVSRKTWHGMESEFNADQTDRAAEFDADQTRREDEFDVAQSYRSSQYIAAEDARNFQTNEFIANHGNYVPVGDYAAGIEITQYNQIVRDTSGEFWRVSGSTELPYTTTGSGLPEGGAFVPVGDAALRQQLASPDGHRLVANQLSAAAYGSPAKAVNVRTAVDAPTIIDYFDGYFWGYRSNNLERSADGETWEIYAAGLGFNFARLIPTSDGEVVGIAIDGVTVRKSIGFNGSSNPTWKTVLTNPSTAVQAPFLRWGFDGKGSKFIVTHYAAESSWANSRYVWISTDAGETWDIVYDTDAVYPGLSSESHIHAACYDPWDDRFYFTEGHGTPNGMYYSDDDGVNWTKIQNIGLSPAPTVLVPTDFGIVIGTDSEPNGVAFLPRSHNPDDVEVQMLATVSSYGGRGGVIGFADRGMRDPETGIVYVAFNSQFATNPTTIFAVGSGGAMPILESVGGDNGAITRYSNVVAAKRKLLATHDVDGRVVADLPPFTQQTKPFDTGNLMPEVNSTRQLALAVGRGATATGQYSMSIGGQTSGNQDRVVISLRGDSGSGANSVVLGNTASAGDNDVVVGFGASAADNGVAIGYNAKASLNNTAVGRDATATNVMTTAVGRNATATTSYSVAIGESASATATYAIAIGYQSQASTSAIAIGGQNSVGQDSLGLGRGAIALTGSVSVGRLAETGTYSVSVGRVAKAGNNSVAIGYYSSALVYYGTAVGDSALAGSAYDTVVGQNAKSRWGSSPQTVVGSSAESDATGGTAVGNGAKVAANHSESVALGRNTETQRAASVCVGNRDIESTRTSGRLILRSPDGTPWAITVDNAGAISATAI